MFMNRINVPIIKVSDKSSVVSLKSLPQLIGLFVLVMSSLLLGALAEGHYAFLRIPNIDPKTQLGAVVTSLPADPTLKAITPDTSPNIIDASSPARNKAVIENAPLIKVDNGTESRQQIDDLNVLVNDHKDAITQLNKELELIKDRSVLLIVEFDQNCGNWKDECATPFAKELEANNSRYSQLVAKLTSFNQELANAERERTLLTQ